MRNKKSIILLSGEIACGKTEFSKRLFELFGFTSLSSKEALIEIAKKKYEGKLPTTRDFLQKFGRMMDKATEGSWILNHYQSFLNSNDRTLIDCVRIKEQIASFRRAYGLAVFHIHLYAPADVRKDRFIKRKKSIDFLSSQEAAENFDQYSSDLTEKNIHQLEGVADLVINTTDSSNINDHVIRAAGFLRILPPIHNKNVDIVVGGQFGSEGKGQVAAYLAPEYDCLVRVGGPNAGHKVYNSPEPDVFHIIPSGTSKARNSKLILGPGSVVYVPTLLSEISKYGLDPDRLLIDQNVTVITEKDKQREEKLDRIGSTKRGVGSATARNLFDDRLSESRKNKIESVAQLKAFVGSAHEEYEKINSAGKKILLEGTQGTFLSLYHGFYPYVTSRDTTVPGCLSEAGIGIGRVRKIVMVTRRYPIRVQNPQHGSSGPFHSEEISLEEVNIRSRYPLEELREIEKTSTTRRQRRIAEFNWALFRKACELNTPTDIAFTFSDYITYDNQQARRFDQLSKETTKFIDELERCAEVPVSLIATRFSNRSIIDRRNWI